MAESEHAWFDDAAGPLVRPYALTGGRTRTATEKIDLTTQVVTARTGGQVPVSSPEHGAVLELCREALSVAEVAAYLDVPLVVAKVLVGDLLERGDVVARSQTRNHDGDRNLLQAVLEGVRRI